MRVNRRVPGDNSGICPASVAGRGRRIAGGVAVWAAVILAVAVPARAQESADEPAVREASRVSTLEADSLAATGSTVLLPVIGYTPDTGVMLGATALRFFYLESGVPDARPSSFSPTVVYTLKSQVLIYLGTELNWDESRNALTLVPNYVNFADQFYGIGRGADLDNEESYTAEHIGLDFAGNRRVWRNWRLGLAGRAMKHRLAETTAGGVLAGGTVTGTGNAWLVTLGPTIALDSRDNTWAPDRGWLLQTSLRWAGPALGSAYDYREWEVDLRGYRTVGRNLVLAGQLLMTSLAGDPPFFVLPRLGGDEGLRGYRGGLYLDRTRALARAELRRSRVWGRLGAVLFAGIGDVAPASGELTLAGRLWTLGGGLRFMLNEKERVNIRLDFGTGNGDSGAFLSLGEAF